MTRQQIEKQEAWVYISGLEDLVHKHDAIFGRAKKLIQNTYDVKVEKWDFSKYENLDEKMVAETVEDADGKKWIAVLIPRDMIA